MNASTRQKFTGIGGAKDDLELPRPAGAREPRYWTRSNRIVADNLVISGVPKSSPVVQTSRSSTTSKRAVSPPIGGIELVTADLQQPLSVSELNKRTSPNSKSTNSRGQTSSGMAHVTWVLPSARGESISSGSNLAKTCSGMVGSSSSSSSCSSSMGLLNTQSSVKERLESRLRRLNASRDKFSMIVSPRGHSSSLERTTTSKTSLWPKGLPSSSSAKISDLRDASVRPIRIHVASWNMEYRSLTETQLMPHNSSDFPRDTIQETTRKFPYVSLEELQFSKTYSCHTPTSSLSTSSEPPASKLGGQSIDDLETSLKEFLDECQRNARTPGTETFTVDEDDDDPMMDISSHAGAKSTASWESLNSEAFDASSTAGINSVSSSRAFSRFTRDQPSSSTDYSPSKSQGCVDTAPVTPAAQKRSAMMASRTSTEKYPLKDWLSPGYDMYVIALQENIADTVEKSVRRYLNAAHYPNRKFFLYTAPGMSLAGRGDGAYFRKKTTSMALFVAQDLLWPEGPVRIIGSAGTSIEGIPGGGGSKGGVSVALEIYNQRICFIGTHLPARSVKSRIAARLQIRENLGRMYSKQLPADTIREVPTNNEGEDQSQSTQVRQGSFSRCGISDRHLSDSYLSDDGLFPPILKGFSHSRKFDVCKIFHHIIWAGDFNFRHHAIQDTASAVRQLSRFNVDGLLRSDELLCSSLNAPDIYIDNYEEAPISFLPTYKKKAGRPPLDFELLAHLSESFQMTPLKWISDEYILYYQKRWYKGRKVTKSVPSWSDRILKWSHPAIKSLLCFVPGTYAPAHPTQQSVLLTSDHSPISCGFTLYSSICPMSDSLGTVGRIAFEQDVTNRTAISGSKGTAKSKKVTEVSSGGPQNRGPAKQNEQVGQAKQYHVSNTLNLTS